MSTEKYIDENGFFVGDWVSEDAESYFSNPDNQVKKLIINKKFSNLDWISYLTDIEEIDIGHWKGEFDGTDIVLDLGLLPHNPNRKTLKISFACTLKSLLNWHKTDATELHFCNLYLKNIEEAEALGFVDNPQESWGENIEKITIYENRETIKLQYFDDKSLKYYHDEQFHYSHDKIELDYLGSCGEVFRWLEEKYTKNPEKVTTAKEIEIIGDHGYCPLYESNRIFTILKTEKINSHSEDDEMFEELEAKGDEAIQVFVDSLPKWPCKLYFSNLALGKDTLPKIYKALNIAGHTLNGV